MAKQKRRVSIVLITVMCVLVVLAIALSVAAVLLETMANTYLGRGTATVVEVEGSEDWDTTYYDTDYTDSADATAHGEDVTEELCEEGFVLLKNQDGALPLDASSTTVSLIGRGAVDPLYGGSGSGNVDASTCATPVSGLEEAGFTVDSASYDFFDSEKDNYTRCSISMDDYDGSQWMIGEVAYDDSYDTAAPFTVASGSVAVYMISRAGGEGWDLSNDLIRDAAASSTFASAVSSGTGKAEYQTYEEGQHQLELSQWEKEWLQFCEDNYSKVIVVVNTSNVMELGVLEDDDDVDAVLWVGGPGSTGFNAMGSILAGDVNPSGHTADIYPADLTANPVFVNANAAVQYTDIGSGDVAIGSAYLTEYEEGIYEGYRYYETAAEEGYITYEDAVVYPFGYGLSYTEFTKEVTDWDVSGDSVEVTVNVTNSGSVAGKEVVQLYYSAPYTDGGIEKSSVVLGDFEKTSTLAAGASEEVTLTLDKEDMASYDYQGLVVDGGGYVLESGEYTLSIRDNSHDVCDGCTYTFTQSSDIKYTTDESIDDGEVIKVEEAATNRFNDITAMFDNGYSTLMSRSDFGGTFPEAPTESNQLAKNITLTYTDEDGNSVSETVADQLAIFDASTQLIDEDAELPDTGADNGLTLSNMRGVGYDDTLWDTFLDQLTESDYTNANTVLINGAYNTAEITSLGKPLTNDYDGPQGFTSLMGSIGACAYCSEVVIASTFNKDIAKEMGSAIGDESLTMGLNGWYGPAMNTHRSAFAGRNFEYYSEDPVLAGKIATEVVEGAAEKGCYAYIKHFAVNDTEVYRTNNQCTWLDEQTMREIYLRPFQIVVENAEVSIKYISDEEGTVDTYDMSACTAVMSSFNRIGGTWAGGSYALQTEVLRDEWGFRGLVISDFNLYDYMDSDQGIRAGTDLQLTWNSFKADFADTSNATTRQAIRTAYKNMCYTVANSNAMQGVAPGSIVEYGLAWWQIAVIVFDVCAAVYVVIAVTLTILKIRKK